MSTVQPTDKTLVNRAGVDHSAPADMSTVQDTDLLLINRAGVDYKCTFADWKASQTKAPDVGAVTLADVAGGSRFTSTAFPVSATMTEDGVPVSTKKLKAYVEGTLKTAAQTSGIVSYGDGTITPPAVASESRTLYPTSTILTPGYNMVAANTGFWAKGTNRTPLTLGTDWGNNGDLFMVKFNAPTMVTAGRSTGSVPMSMIASDDGDTWFLVDNKPAPGYSNPATCLRGTSPHTYWGIYRPQVDPTRFDTAMDGVYSFGALSSTGKVLTLTDNTQLINFAAGDAITEVTSTGTAGDATGTVGAVDAVAKTITLGSSSGTWDVGSAVKGPLKTPAGGASVKLYCKLNATGAVTDLQSADPGFTAWTPAGTGPYTGTVTFPATLPTGNAPDVDLPAATTITVEVQATNASGSDSAKSNTVTPA